MPQTAAQAPGYVVEEESIAADVEGMQPSDKSAKSIDPKIIHSFFVPWRRAHKKREQQWQEKRSMNWTEVNCSPCLQHKPEDGGNGSAKKK